VASSNGSGCAHSLSDDYLWLPLTTCRYVLTTGDTGVLDEPVHFVQGRPVKADETLITICPSALKKRRVFTNTASEPF